MLENKVVGDLLSARRVSVGSESQPSVTDYIAWLDIKNDNVNKNHQATSKVQRLTFATAGVLKKSDIQEEGSNEFNKLVWSTKQSMLVDSEDVRFAPDPTMGFGFTAKINPRLNLNFMIKNVLGSNNGFGRKIIYNGFKSKNDILIKENFDVNDHTFYRIELEGTF